ncbi:cation channel sperm-associated protein 4-like [Paramacrobiotus metropolitanus]|uniref:cation channel sperm-associated protein 4-like n=1 Tax=Paramacrobiotus metropolitanus TaxID=2943436 RepID=UPI002445B708|nr:cation channel sperm-associated protein 4-like [Paramacrobiotus metropolitanus]
MSAALFRHDGPHGPPLRRRHIQTPALRGGRQWRHKTLRSTVGGAGAAFQRDPSVELSPFLLVDQNDDANPPAVVRRRILVEPAFGRQQRNTGQAEDQFRQIVLDQGITDKHLLEEIKRGSNNLYELGKLLPLRNVHDYVDYSSEELAHTYFKEHATGNLLLSNGFRYAILFVILWNTVLIGLETHPTLSLRYAALFEAMENIIMAAFIIEILIKWYYNFDVFWKGGWNILDFLIVCVLFFGSNWHFLGTSRVLRILRVVRAFRSLRDTPLFSGLSLIFQTVTRSLPDMVNISLLMALVICLLGVVGVLVFGDFAPNNFGTFSDAVFSVFICQTQRGWINIFNPFIAAGGGYYIGSFLYFVLTITLTAFILKNLFVAVVVSNLKKEMRLAKAERERQMIKRQNALPPKPPTDGDQEEEDEADAKSSLVPMVEAARHWKAGDTQRRVLSPMFLNMVNVEEYRKFLLLQAALEINLTEYEQLRAQFKQVHDAVAGLNENYFRALRKDTLSRFSAPRKRSKLDVISKVSV